MASSFYPKVFKPLLRGEVDLRPIGEGGSTVKVMLLNQNYTFSETHAFVSNIVANELVNDLPNTNPPVVVNYERKDIALTLTEVLSPAAQAGCDLEFALTGSAVWGGDPLARATFTVRHAVMFIQGTNDADSRLLYYFDLGSNQTVSSGTFSLISPSVPPRVRVE